VANANGSVSIPVSLSNNGLVVTCTAVDAAGNKGSATETVVVALSGGTYPC
jgi:hypothetical protein